MNFNVDDMDIRKFVFDWWRGTTPVQDFHDVMFEDSSIDDLPSARPFATYRFGTLRPDTGGADRVATWFQAVYMQIHTDPGDYHTIDQWLVPWTMNLGNSFPPALIAAHPYVTLVELDYLSEDFRNPDWNTIFRTLRLYIRGRNPNI